MAVSPSDSWNRARQAFADQFEKYGAGVVYRRSQKGEAIPVSAEEQDRFIGEFNRNIRRASWLLYAGMFLVLGAIILLSVVKSSDVSEAAIIVGIIAALIPYLAYYRWAWAAPARELAGRTPVARERDPEEVQRLRFQRISYGQLAGAAVGGLAIPLFQASHHDVLSGYGRLWLVVGGGIVLLSAVQAFRKWRIEQDGPYGAGIPPAVGDISRPDAPETAQTGEQLWRYVPFAVIVLAAGFIGLTSTGRQLAHAQSFWPILVVGAGGWALFTVWRGAITGKIHPFVRGFYSSYERDTQPKRFWASMAWNAVFGCLCIWGAFAMLEDASARAVEDRCYNEHHEFSAMESSKACTDLIEGRARLTYLTREDAYLDRAIAEHRSGDRERAFADYTQALELNPKDYYAYLDRGLLSLDVMHLDAAVADFSRAHDLKLKSPWPIANRGMAFAWKNDRARADADFAAVRAVDPKNLVVLHGEGVLDMNENNLEGAVAEFSAALRQDPSDLWSLQTRADAYQQMGDFEKARADREKLAQLSQKRS